MIKGMPGTLKHEILNMIGYIYIIYLKAISIKR